MQVHRLFANEMAEKGKMAQGNVLKDKHTMVRYVYMERKTVHTHAIAVCSREREMP